MFFVVPPSYFLGHASPKNEDRFSDEAVAGLPFKLQIILMMLEIFVLKLGNLSLFPRLVSAGYAARGDRRTLSPCIFPAETTSAYG